MKIAAIFVLFMGSTSCSLEPPGYGYREAHYYRNLEPPGYRNFDLPSYRSLEPAGYRSLEPRGFRSQEPRGFRSQEPRGFRSLEPRGFRSLEPRGFRSLEPPGYQSLEPSGYRSLRQYLPPDRPPRRQPSLTLSAPFRHYMSNDATEAHNEFENRPVIAEARRTAVPSTGYGEPDYETKSSRYHRQHREQKHENEGEPAKYKFAYHVKDSDNDYSHQESRNGTLTRGSYSVLLPDGRRQIVEYEADEAGYRPKISYEAA